MPSIDAYKENNDWMSAFLNERCEIDDTAVVKSGELYNEYRSFCLQVGEYVRSSADFYTAVESFCTAWGYLDSRQTSSYVR